MSITLSALQQQRRDTAANWTSANPTLLAGEWGYETDTGKWKVGDGSTAWTSLAYVAIPDNNGLIPIDQLLLPLGTAAAPSLTFTGDVDTGIYSPGANQLAISTNGIGRLFIDASGNVGVGSTAPSSLLHIGEFGSGSPELTIASSTSGTGTLRFGDGSTGNKGYRGYLQYNHTNDSLTIATAASPAATIDSSGRLGLGSTDPADKLEVAGDIRLKPASGANTLINFEYNNGVFAQIRGNGRNGSPLYGDLEFWTKNSTDGAPVERMVVSAEGRVGIGTTSPLNKLVASNSGAEGVEFAPGFSSNLNRIQHYNRSASSYIDSVHIANSHQFWKANTTEAARFDSSGRLLVGTSTASASSSGTWTKLEISNQNLPCAFDVVRNDQTVSSGNTVGSIRFWNNDDSGYQECAHIQAAADGDYANDDKPTRLVFSTTADGASSPTPRMTIKSDGKVGIGNTSPDTILRVTASAVNEAAQANDVAVFERNDNGYIKIYNANNKIGGLAFGDPEDAFVGAVRYDHSVNAMDFFVNNEERATIDSSGRLLVGTSSSSTNGIGVFSGYAGTPAGTGVVDIKHGGTVASAGNDVGQVNFYDTNGQFAQILCEADGTTGSGDYPGRLVFSTTSDSASSPTERMRITSNGTVIFGSSGSTTAPTLYFVPDSGGGYFYKKTNSTNARNAFIFENPNGVVGSIVTSASATAYNTSSDYRLKENIAPLTSAADRVNQLQVHRFNFIADPDKTVDGFLAHEVQTVVPEAITGEKDAVDDEGNPEYQGIDQSKLVPLLTAALQEALAKIETLEQRLSDAGIA